LTPEERRKCCHLVKPATILAWFRQLAARKYDSSEARRGRPSKPNEVRKLVNDVDNSKLAGAAASSSVFAG